MKKYKIFVLVIMLCLMSNTILVSAAGNNDTVVATEKLNEEASEKLIKEQMDGWEKLNQDYNSGKLVIQADKTNGSNGDFSTKAMGTYPTRSGVILVTDSAVGSFGSIVGHAGIIHSSYLAVESFKENGVYYYANDWDTRYSGSNVYGVTASGTTNAEDNTAAVWAYRKWGCPYNTVFFDINTRTKFYCSHLVYAAFIDNFNINLNQGGGIVTPLDLVQTSNTYTLYQN